MLMPWLNADGKRVLLCRALRNFAYGFLVVILAIYLGKLGLSSFLIGAVFTAAVAGSAAMTVLWSLLADRVGRRRTVVCLSALMVAGGLLFAFGSHLPLLLAGAFTGTISVTNSESGAFTAVEQAILPQTAPTERRTWLFSLYEMLAYLSVAAGALFAGLAGPLAAAGLNGPDAYRPFFLLYALAGLLNMLLFRGLSPKIELAKVEGKRQLFGLHRSRGTVGRMAGLFAVDAFAGGFVVQSLVAYWFHLRWGLPAEALSVVFFWVNVISGLSLLAAGPLARRFGLLNTMVFSHLPSNILLLLVPLAPSAWLAVAIVLLRVSVSQMDVPTRKSYLMAVVDADERTAAAGITSVARVSASAVSPLLTGIAFNLAALGLPFFIAGALKSGYDLTLLGLFRSLRPPEELEASGHALPGQGAGAHQVLQLAAQEEQGQAG